MLNEAKKVIRKVQTGENYTFASRNNSRVNSFDQILSLSPLSIIKRVILRDKNNKRKYFIVVRYVIMIMYKLVDSLLLKCLNELNLL